MFSESIPGMCCFMRLEAGGSFLLFFLFMSCPFFLSFLVRSFSSWHERFIADGGWRLFLSFLSLLGHRSCSFLVHAFLFLSFLARSLLFFSSSSLLFLLQPGEAGALGRHHGASGCAFRVAASGSFIVRSGDRSGGG